MKRRSAVWFVLFSSTMALAAQNAAPQPQGFGVAGTAGGPNQFTVLQFSAPVMGCPVSLRAQHLAGSGMIRTGNMHSEDVGQRLHLALTDNRASKIVRARVTVHGYSNKARLTEMAIGSGASDAAQTITVPFSTGQAGPATGEVWVAGMTAVATIDLDSVTYADGSVWKVAGQAACRFTPDPLMLVAGR
jgi:hypothetical protein